MEILNVEKTNYLKDYKLSYSIISTQYCGDIYIYITSFIYISLSTGFECSTDLAAILQ